MTVLSLHLIIWTLPYSQSYGFFPPEPQYCQSRPWTPALKIDPPPGNWCFLRGHQAFPLDSVVEVHVLYSIRESTNGRRHCPLVVLHVHGDLPGKVKVCNRSCWYKWHYKTYPFSEDFCWLISRWISAQVVSSFYFVRLITRQLRKRRICPSYKGVTYCPVFCKTGAYDWNKFKKDQMRNGPRLLLLWLLIPSFEKVDKSFNKYFSTLVEKGQKINWKQNMRKLRTSLGLIWAHLWSLGLTWEHMSHVRAKKLNVFVAWVKAVLVHGTLPILITFVTPLSFKT